MDDKHMVDEVLDHIGSIADAGVVAGAPIALGDITVVILSMISIGMGAAGGEGRGEPTNRRASNAPGSGLGEGAGGGAKVRPAAAIVFTPTGVEVLPIPAQPGMIDKMVERVPEIVDMVERARESFEHA